MDNQVFAQAKIEYNKQLLDILINPIFNKFRSIYDKAKIIYSKDTNSNMVDIYRNLLS